MTVSRDKPIDFTVMCANHAAFRRDLDRIVAASVVWQNGSPQVHAGWAHFKVQLLLHCRVEDTRLWSRLRRAHQPQAPGGHRASADPVRTDARGEELDPRPASTPYLANRPAGMAGALPAAESVERLMRIGHLQEYAIHD